MEPLAVGGRRAARQDARHRRARSGRRARRAARATRSACSSSAYDPYVSADRARQLGVELVPTLEELVRRGRLPHHPPAEDARDDGPDLAPSCSRTRSPTLRHRQHRARRHRRRSRARRRDRDGRIAGAALDVFAAEPTTESPLFGLPSVVVTPHLGASTVEAQDKAGQTIAEQVVLALRGEFVPFAVNLAATEANATVQPFLPLVERLGRLFTALAGGVVDTLEVSYEGQIADYDCRVLTLGGAEGRARPGRRRAGELRERAAARRGARARRARDQASSSARDYVNLVELRGQHRSAARRTSPARSTASRTRRASSASTTTSSTCRRRATCSSCATRTCPGMIGRVGTILGDAGVNIDDMDVGRGPQGDVALMAALDVHAGAGGGGRPSCAPATASSTPAPSSSTDSHRRSLGPDVADGRRAETSRAGSSAWRGGGRRPRRRRRRRSSGRRGCGRSWRRRARGRCRSRSFAFTGWRRAGTRRPAGSTHGGAAASPSARWRAAVSTGGRERVRRPGTGWLEGEPSVSGRDSRRSARPRSAAPARTPSRGLARRQQLEHRGESRAIGRRCVDTAAPDLADWCSPMTKELRTQSLLLT